MASDVTLANLDVLNVHSYFGLIAYSILLYDYCLTFGAEVERCWGIGRLSWALGLFYLNRYLVLFGHVPIMFEFFWSPSNSNEAEICSHFQTFHQYLAIVIQIVVASMLIMRMYALYERSIKVLVLFIVVAVLILVVGCWAMLGGKDPDVQSSIGCNIGLGREKAIRFAAAWAGMLVFDSLVFCMTMYKSMLLPLPDGANILGILIRDGTIYFGVMVVSNLANILTFILGGPFTRGIVTSFTNIISSVMISRLMLNLRHPALGNGLFVASMTEKTYPNLTFVEPEYLTHTERTSSWTFAPLQPRHAREVYRYLETGTSKKPQSEGVEMTNIICSDHNQNTTEVVKSCI